MTNQQPTKKEIIEAIKKKAQKKQKKWVKNDDDQIRFQSKTDRQPVRSPQPSIVRQIIKRINDQPLDPRISPLIDSRCRYWVENRISQLLASNNFTTRSGYSFSIDNDRTNGGLCFRFMNNGTTIVRIDSRGYIYCANVVIGKTSISSLLEQLQNTNANMALYVKHVDLKNGTYEMDIDSIKSRLIEASERVLIEKPIINGNFVGLKCIDTTDPDNPIDRIRLYMYGAIRCQIKIPNLDNNYNFLTGICPDLPENTFIGFRLGKAVTRNNMFHFEYYHIGDGSADNHLSMGFMLNGRPYVFYNNYFKILSNRYLLIESSNDNINQNYCLFKRSGNDGVERFKVEHSGRLLINTSRTESIISMNPIMGNSGQNRFWLGKSASNYNCGTITYFHTTDGDSNNYLSLGLYGSHDAFRMFYNHVESTKMMFITLGSADKINALTMSKPNALQNGHYIRQVLTDGTKTGYLSLTHDSQYYRMKLGLDGSTPALYVNESGIEMDGVVDIHNDLTLWQGLWVKDINEAYAGQNINFHNNVVIDNSGNSNMTLILEKAIEENSSQYLWIKNTLPSGMGALFGCKRRTGTDMAAVMSFYAGYANIEVDSNFITLTGTYITTKGKLETTKTTATDAFGPNMRADISELIQNNQTFYKPITLNISEVTTYPIDITTPTLSSNASTNIRIKDGSNYKAVFGMMNNGVNHYAYVGLEGGSSSIDVAPTNVQLNSNTITMNGKLESTQSTASNALGDSLQKAIIDLVYPIGSFYMSANPLVGEKHVSGIATIKWMGATWTPISGHKFFRSAAFSTNGDTWDYTDGGVTGGVETHKHNYGIRFGNMNGTIVSTDSNYGLALYDQDHWTTGSGVSSASCNVPSSITPGVGTSIYQILVQTSGTSNLPPYKNIYIYQRIA